MSNGAIPIPDNAEQRRAHNHVLLLRDTVTGRPLSRQQLAIERSHIKKIQQMGYPDVRAMTDADAKKLIESLFAQRAKENYIISILTTLRRYNKNITIKQRELQLRKPKRRNGITSDLSAGFDRVLSHCLLHAQHMRPNVAKRIEVYSTITVLLASTTNINSEALMRLQYYELANLRDPNRMSTVDLKVLKKRQEYVVEALATYPMVHDIILRMLSFVAPEIRDDDFVIGCGIDSINKYLRDLYVQLNQAPLTGSFGVQFIRNLDTTLLEQKVSTLLRETREFNAVADLAALAAAERQAQERQAQGQGGEVAAAAPAAAPAAAAMPPFMSGVTMAAQAATTAAATAAVAAAEVPFAGQPAAPQPGTLAAAFASFAPTPDRSDDAAAAIGLDAVVAAYAAEYDQERQPTMEQEQQPMEQGEDVADVRGGDEQT